MFAPSEHPVGHVVFNVAGGGAWDYLHLAMNECIKIGISYRDENGGPNITQSLEDRPAQINTRAHKPSAKAKATASKRGRK